MSCSAMFCSSRTTKGGVKDPELSFHTFPKCPEIRNQWIKAIRRKNWEPTRYSRLCSKHFEKSSFVAGLSIKKLKSFAIPTILEGYPKYYQPTSRPELRKRPPKKAPPRLPFSSSEESDDGRVGQDDSIYERDVSPITEDGGDHESDYEDDVEATVPEGFSDRHEGHRCDVCRGDIFGFRYACLQCASFDLCGACEACGEHDAHYVLRIPPAKLHSDVQAVIKKIRDQLLQEDVGEDLFSCIKVEIKEEAEQDPLEQSACPADEIPQEDSSQSQECEESEDTLAVELQNRDERDKQTVLEVSLSHEPSVPQEQAHQSKQKLQGLPRHPQVQTYSPVVRRVSTHQTAVPQVSSHKKIVRRRQPKLVTQQPEVQSMPVSSAATTLENSPRTVEVQGLGTVLILSGTAGATGRDKGDADSEEQSAGKGEGGKYVVYTHHADSSRATRHDPSTESPSTGEDSQPTGKKRKK